MKHANVKRMRAELARETPTVSPGVEIYEHPPGDDREPAVKLHTESLAQAGPAAYSVPQLRALPERIGSAGPWLTVWVLPSRRYERRHAADSLEAADAWLRGANGDGESYVLTPCEPAGIREALPTHVQATAVIAELRRGPRERERLYVALLPDAPGPADGYVIRVPAQLPHPDARASARGSRPPRPPPRRGG